MSHENYWGRAVFASVAARDAAIAAIEDFVQATEDSVPFENASEGLAGGCTPFSNLHLQDTQGPGLAWSYKLNYNLQDAWMTVLGPYVVDVTDEHQIGTDHVDDLP